MDYSKFSDTEINLMVGEIVSHDKMSILSSGGFALIHEFQDCGDFKRICLGWKRFDPCSSPSDAWPIIVENKISIIIDDTTDEWSSASLQDFTDTAAYKHGNSNKNPLRTAMITFLMMNEPNGKQ